MPPLTERVHAAARRDDALRRHTAERVRVPCAAARQVGVDSACRHRSPNRRRPPCRRASRRRSRRRRCRLQARTTTSCRRSHDPRMRDSGFVPNRDAPTAAMSPAALTRPPSSSPCARRTRSRAPRSSCRSYRARPSGSPPCPPCCRRRSPPRPLWWRTRPGRPRCRQGRHVPGPQPHLRPGRRVARDGDVRPGHQAPDRARDVDPVLGVDGHVDATVPRSLVPGNRTRPFADAARRELDQRQVVIGGGAPHGPDHVDVAAKNRARPKRPGRSRRSWWSGSKSVLPEGLSFLTTHGDPLVSR